MPTEMEGTQVATGAGVPNVIIRSDALTATPENDITGATGAIVYFIMVDCRLNPAQDVTARLYHDDAATDVGADDAQLWVRGYKGKKKTYWFEGLEAAATKINIACVQEKGGTVGSTSPTGTVKLAIGLDDGS